MCGIAGILHPKAINKLDHNQLAAMLSVIKHRGPDSTGIYKENRDVCLGSVRLAMIDSYNEISWISNEDSSILLIFNGEIYNHKPLRRSLEDRGHQFRTHSDGEIIVHLYEELEVQLLHQLDGMFAFALWDSHRERLFLARDPFGIKPLYYQTDGSRLVFASELKAIAAIQPQSPEIDLIALSNYFDYRFVAPPRTIFQKISKLEPGSYLVAEKNSINIYNYWSPNFNDRKEEQGSLDKLWEEAVKTTAISDHQLGVFLSGGLDSSGILAILSQTNLSVPTFTIGYESDCKEDEGVFALELAQHMKSQHRYEQIKQDEVAEDLQKVIWHLEEPLYSTVSLSTYRLAKMASNHVKGVLTGDGSDELLLGYSYLFKAYDALVKGNDWEKEYLYQIGWMTENWKEKLVESNLLPRDNLLQKTSEKSPLDVMRWFEIKYRLPEYHLARMDRLSMAHGLEARVPFLRKGIVNYLLSYPSSSLLIPGKQKEVLKEVFLKFLPEKVIQRKKQSFTAPFTQWLKGPLKQEVYDLILGTNYHQDLYLKKDGLIQMLENCYHGSGSAFSVLWGIFTIYKWYEGVKKNENFSSMSA